MSELYNQCNGITFLSCTAPNSALEVTLVGCSSEFLNAVLQPCLWPGCSADPVCLGNFSAVTAHIILYLAASNRQAFIFLSSSPLASDYCKNV